MQKTRLDVYMHENGLAESRQKATAMILSGNVLVDEKPCKPSTPVTNENVIRVKEEMPFVSRGGYKLEKALSQFGLVLDSVVAMDIGASTGGFTDCMLQAGAKLVYAIDVGYGQLSWKLRNDGRVVVMERCNARNIKPDMFLEKPSFASIDVSFISLKHIFVPLFACLNTDSNVVALIKPQFEAEKASVGKNGVIRSEKTHLQVIRNCIGYANEAGFSVIGLDHSPIKGPKGNIEFLLHIKKCGAVKNRVIDIEQALENAKIFHN